LYATNRQAEAEAIVRILQEDRSRENGDGDCSLCGGFEDHDESCPFRLSDEFIAKYGTHPPAGPTIEPLIYLKAEGAARR